MSTRDQNSEPETPVRYRLELAGELPPEWAAWFGAERVSTGGGRTVLELAVPDQAALHGVLRRVHDLHLRLIALTSTEQADS